MLEALKVRFIYIVCSCCQGETRLFSFDYMDTKCNTTKSKMHEKADMGVVPKISCQCGVPRQRNITAFYVL